MPGESPRPETADHGRLRPWSALIVLLLALPFAYSGGGHADGTSSRPTASVKVRHVAATVVVATPSPVPTPQPTRGTDP